MGVGFGSGWVIDSWVHKFACQWVELGWVRYFVGWVGLGPVKWTDGQLWVTPSDSECARLAGNSRLSLSRDS